MLADLLKYPKYNENFFFVPFIGFPERNFSTNLNEAKEFFLSIGQSQASIDKINDSLYLSYFFDLCVERPILEEFLSDPTINRNFYNVKTIGRFQEGVPQVRSPLSGAPSKPLCHENYAWESHSAMSSSLQVDRKAINYKLKAKIKSIQEISSEEFDNFKGIKITNKEASIFFNNNKPEFLDLRKKLFPRSKLDSK